MIKKIDYLIIAVIVAIYSFFALYKLGDFKSPSNFYTSQRGVGIYLDIDEAYHDVSIKKIMVFYGISNDVTCDIYVPNSDDVKESLPLYESDLETPLENSSMHSDYVSTFKWHEYYTDTAASQLYLYFQDFGMEIGEFALLDENGQTIPYTVSPECSGLNNEQNLVPKAPSYINSTYFDEVYHPRTAYEIINEKTIYETTHPPLGKNIIALGLMIFGFGPFGWRIMGALAGIAMLPVLYILILKMFKKSSLASFTTILFAADFMHLSLTRIGTIDSFSILWILLSLLYMCKYFSMDLQSIPLKKTLGSLALSGLFFGIGAATKWVCIYSAFGLATILLVAWIRTFLSYDEAERKLFYNWIIKTILWCVVFFAIVPITIYILSYLPQARFDLREGENIFEYVIRNQTYMFKYHSAVTSEHPYASRWYSWIFTERPLFAYIDGALYQENIISSISIFGNPAIWWLGAFCVPLSIYIAISKKDYKGLFLPLAYLAQLLPWVMITRPLFIYHYFACVAPMIGMIVYSINTLAKKHVLILTVLCTISVLIFLAFYPVLTGIAIPREYAEFLKWLPRWTLF